MSDNNGTKRSLKVVVTKYEGAVIASGYPKTYDGMTASSTWTDWTGTEYTAINDSQLAEMSDVTYQARLADFILWVESQESGLDFDTDIIAGSEAEIVDLTGCPLPSSYYVVDVTSNNEALGAVYGSTIAYENDSVTVRAVPASGAQFDYWTVTEEGGTPTQELSAIYTFSATKNIELVAEFSVSYEITYSIAFSNYVCQKV